MTCFMASVNITPDQLIYGYMNHWYVANILMHVVFSCSVSHNLVG